MARYWVGGTGNWSDNTNHWSDSSDGSPGATKPTSSDDVFIDENSGFGSGGTITIDENSAFKDFTSTSGHTYTIGFDGYWTIRCWGSFIGESGLSFGQYGEKDRFIYFSALSGSESVTSNGCELPRLTFGPEEEEECSWTITDNTGAVDLGLYSGSVTLGGDLILTGELDLENGTFDANDYNVTANDFYFYADDGYTPTVYMGSGIWEATGTFGIWYIEQYNDEVVTIVPETSTIKFSDVSKSSKSLYFYDDTANETGKTYNNFLFSGDGALFVNGSNTFNNFEISSTPGDVAFEAGKTQIISSFTVSGSIGNVIRIDSSDGEGSINGSPTSWSYPSGGSGYVVGDVIYGNAGNKNFYFEVTEVDGSGAPTNGQTLFIGSGYSIANDVPCLGGTGSGATFDILAIRSGIGQHTLSKSSGTVECDYLDISNSNATGGATWYAGSHSVDTDNNDGWIFSDASTSVNTSRGLWVAGKDSSGSTRGLWIDGGLESNTSRGLWISGRFEGNATRNFWIAGLDSSSTSRGLWIAGLDLSSINRGLWMTGSDSGDSTRSLWVSGLDSSSVSRGLWVAGRSGSSETRGFWIDGYDTNGISRGLWIDGGLVGSENRGLWISGSAQSSATRGLRIEGYEIGSATRALYLEGKIPGEATRGLWIYGGVASMTMYMWDGETWIEVTSVNVYIGD